MSRTRVIPVLTPDDAERGLVTAVEVLRRGGLVVFPTETVYGLGADASNAEAVRSVFDAKGRPQDNPLIVHMSDSEQAFTVARDVSPFARQLAAAFWPGPLTLVVRSDGSLPAQATAGLSTVAIRVPDHPVARRLAGSVSRGIVGPSANLSGRPSPTTAGHALLDLDGRVDVILDAGPTVIGIESTVVDVTGERPTVLRSGGVSVEWIAALVGDIGMRPDAEQARRSPGTRYRHYAPRASIVLIEQGDQTGLQREVAQARRIGLRVGLLSRSPGMTSEGLDSTMTVEGDVAHFARALFASLRQADADGIDVLLVEKPPPEGIGLAILDRLIRAAQK